MAEIAVFVVFGGGKTYKGTSASENKAPENLLRIKKLRKEPPVYVALSFLY